MTNSLFLDKRFKDIVSYADVEVPRQYHGFSLPSLNYIVSGGKSTRGIRSGSIFEIYGAKSSGKSTLAADFISNLQCSGKDAAYIAFERWYEKDYTSFLGVDNSKLIMVKPKTTEQGFTAAQQLVENGIGLVVIDSIAAAIPKDEWEKEYDDNERLGESAKLIKRYIQRMSVMAYDSNSIVLVLNQIRANVSPMSQKKTKKFGGNAYDHALDVSIELTVVEHKDAEAWKRVQAFTEKQRISGAERMKTEYVIKYGEGLHKSKDILDFAIREGIVIQAGSRYSYHTYKAHGFDNMCETFPIDDIRRELEAKINSN